MGNNDKVFCSEHTFFNVPFVKGRLFSPVPPVKDSKFILKTKCSGKKKSVLNWRFFGVRRFSRICQIFGIQLVPDKQVASAGDKACGLHGCDMTRFLVVFQTGHHDLGRVFGKVVSALAH